ncbi:endonuclease/exonuclease/phosphatase family protein [Vibrio sp. S11_S32]|uniref:endonuclease/exonuclease/phosphatase family protein n=1 Tax=Vibrio sp. S11_S32 TaxID=2720225 RepID=UPI0016801BB9|nr:endonuclease/exonuclease/phosphatase family protein [Vibrio sp. S11_S32]MBD1576511.1 endonuclease/exonuclease/phosphatase family protein [Vibrio sp. S11_S32]
MRNFTAPMLALVLSGFCGFFAPTVQANDLNVATWNLEWLTTKPSRSIPQSKRSSQDFARLNDKFVAIQADILAFQEVDSKAAIKKVVGPFYHIYLSDRSWSSNKSKQFSDVNQYTGLAISKKWKVSDPRDLIMSPNSKLRFGTYVVLKRIGEPNVHLLSVHLKQGCIGKKSRSKNCSQLSQQGKKLNQWMQTRLNNKEAFIVMGDFNHNLSFHGNSSQNDWLWLTLNKGIERQVELVTATTDAFCQVKSRNDPNELYRYPSLIDHIIISKPGRASQGKQVLFSREEALYHHLSDHCPVASTVDIRQID